MELNQVIKRRLKNKPRTRKNVKAAGFYQEELSLPKRGHLIDGDAIDQIANVISVLGHDETAEQMFLRHFTFSLTKTEQESLEKFFDDGTLIPVDYKGFGIEDLRLEQKRSPYLAKSAKIKLTDWKI